MELKFLSWNVEGKGSPEEIDKALIHTPTDPDLVCLQEANLPSDGEDTTNFKWCRTGSYGTAILIKKTSCLKVEFFKRYCDQISAADITGGDIKVRVISCYIPPSDDYQSDDVWLKLNEIIKTIPGSIPFLLAGDFNAQLGNKDRAKVDDLIMGSGIYHDVCNENGVKLKQLAIKGHLQIRSTFMDKKKCFTFKNGDVQYQQDFVLIPLNRVLLLKNFSKSSYTDFRHAKLCCTVWPIIPPRKQDMIEKGKKRIIIEGDSNIDDTQQKEDSNLKGKQLDLSSWNIQSATPANVDSLLKEIDLSPIICIQELFLTSDEDIQTENFTWLCSKTLWAKNVGILVKKSEDIEILSFEPVSEYLCMGSFVVSGKNWTIVSCQLPPPTDSQHEEVVTQIIGLINGFPEETNFIISGELGSTSSEENKGLKRIIDESKVKVMLQSPMAVMGKMKLNKQLCTRITDSEGSSPFCFLLPTKLSETIRIKCFCEWIPFFENSILILRLYELNNPIKTTVTAEIDGVFHKIQKYFVGARKKGSSKSANYDDEEDDLTNEEEPPNFAIAKLLTKFKDTPVPLNDFREELSDFVIIYGPEKSSKIRANASNVLAKSLRANNLGNLEVETDRLTEKSGYTFRKAIKLKLRGITLFEKEVDPNTAEEKAVDGMAREILDNLTQTCYTVKGRRTYFNKGLRPRLMGDPALANTLRKVDRASFSSFEDVYKYIDDFVKEDSDIELIFGNKFSQEEQSQIINYVKHPKLDYRTFRSAVLVKPDYVAVSMKRSPQYIRDMLIRDPSNYKYYLMPPAGIGTDIKEYGTEITTKVNHEDNLIDYYCLKVMKTKIPFEEWLKTRTSGPGIKRTGVRRRGSTKRTSSNNLTETPMITSSPYPVKELPAGSRPTNGVGGPIVTKRPLPNWLKGPGPKKRKMLSSEQNLSGPQPNLNLGQRLHSAMSKIPPSGGKDQRREAGLRPKMPPWGYLQPLVMVWPVNTRSQLETRPKQILEANFPIKFIQEPECVAAVITLKLLNGTQKDYCLAVEANENTAARVAMSIMLKRSTVIKPNPNFMCDGGTPNFVRYKVPCQTSPRTYIILGVEDTGPLTQNVLSELLETFKNSLNEDVFFDRFSYSYAEKTLMMDEARRCGLNVRHFGEGTRVADHYICVYKRKPKNEILQEVLKMRGNHPKYVITTDRLPPHLAYNTF